MNMEISDFEYDMREQRWADEELPTYEGEDEFGVPKNGAPYLDPAFQSWEQVDEMFFNLAH